MPANMPLVTIGLAVRNGGSLLRESFASLQAQDYPHLEIVISDNASTDSTLDFCLEAAKTDPRIRVFRQSKNIGSIANLRFVLENAGGKYFLWGSHDDLWDVNFVSALVELLEQDDAATLATSATFFVGNDGSYTEQCFGPACGRTGLGDLIAFDAKDWAACWIYGVFRTQWMREIISQVGPSCLAWDQLFMFRVLSFGRTVGSSKTALWKRVHGGSFVPKNAFEWFRMRLRITARGCRIIWGSPHRVWTRLHACRVLFSSTYRNRNRSKNLFKRILHVRKMIKFAIADLWISASVKLRKEHLDPELRTTRRVDPLCEQGYHAGDHSSAEAIEMTRVHRAA